MPIDPSKAAEQWERYSYFRDRGHLDFVAKANRCDDYFAGNQWDPITKRKLERQRRPALTINKTLATLATAFGEQLENRADVAFLPSRNGVAETASALNKVFIQIGNQNNLRWCESQVAADGFVTSRGFFDVRVSFNDHMEGEVVIRKENGRNVLIDPEAEEYDPDTWKGVMLTKWLTPNDVSMLYNKDDGDYLKEKEGSDYMMGYDSIDRAGNFGGNYGDPYSYQQPDPAHRRIRVIEYQHKQLRMAWHLVDLQTGDMRAMPEGWDGAKLDQIIEKARSQGIFLGKMRKLIEQIRWTVTADNVVLFDDWSPYKHFTVIPYFPFFRNGNTIGVCENLLDPQDLLNKSSSQELHVVNTTANSGWKVKTGALQNMSIEELEQRGAETGLIAELDDIKNMDKITPNQIPTGLDRIGFKADQWIKDISGISDSMRGFDRADVAAKAIEAKQMAGSINLATPMDNLAHTRSLLARNVLDLVQTYYTEHRIVHIVHGREGINPYTEQLSVNEPTPEGKLINDLTLGEYEVVITPVPSRRTWEESQFNEVLQMRQLGIDIPTETILEYSHLEKKQEILESMAEQAQAQQAEAQQMQQLEMQAKQVEIAAKAADVRLKEANAKLAEARANATLWDMTEEESSDVQAAEQQVLAAEKQRHDLQMADVQMQQKMAHQQQMHELGKRERTMKMLMDARDRLSKNKQQGEMHQQKMAQAKALPKPKPQEPNRAR